MYGTVARIRIKPGRFDDVLALFEEWDRDFRPKVKGAGAGYLYRLDADANQAIMVATFENKDLYTRNANDPEQDKWFRRFRELLEADPEWNDGEVVYSG
jgi:quinol monooxygenase YgiN